jgi:predicted nuclease of predicted toxin-antitoxin system
VHFLIDACLPKEFAAAVALYGHAAVDVHDIGMARADDPDIATYAQRNQFCLFTGGSCLARQARKSTIARLLEVSNPSSVMDV